MQVLDLTGCNIEEVLYYVSCGSPVFSMTGSTDAVLIIGYDSNSVVIFDPALGTDIPEDADPRRMRCLRRQEMYFSHIW